MCVGLDLLINVERNYGSRAVFNRLNLSEEHFSVLSNYGVPNFIMYLLHEEFRGGEDKDFVDAYLAFSQNVDFTEEKRRVLIERAFPYLRAIAHGFSPSLEELIMACELIIKSPVVEQEQGMEAI